MFTPIGNLLNRLPKRSKLSGAMSAVFVFKAWDDALAKEAPEVSAGLAKARSFKNGTLTVGCTSVVSGELTMRARGLIRAMNDNLGKRVVVKISFRKV